MSKVIATTPSKDDETMTNDDTWLDLPGWPRQWPPESAMEQSKGKKASEPIQKDGIGKKWFPLCGLWNKCLTASRSGTSQFICDRCKKQSKSCKWRLPMQVLPCGNGQSFDCD